MSKEWKGSVKPSLGKVSNLDFGFWFRAVIVVIGLILLFTNLFVGTTFGAVMGGIAALSMALSIYLRNS